MGFWFTQVFVALDQLLNAVLGGWADETLSSRAWRTGNKGRLAGRIAQPVIDTIFFWQEDHCWSAFVAERYQRQSPPEARSTDQYREPRQ